VTGSRAAAKVIALRARGLSYRAIAREMGWSGHAGAVRAHVIAKRAGLTRTLPPRLPPADPWPDETDAREPERPFRALAVAVLARAMRDALRGDAEAVAWVTDPRAVELWAAAAGRDPADFARCAMRVLESRAA
jgi:hypothetical protein